MPLFTRVQNCGPRSFFIHYERDVPRWRLELHVEDASLHWHLDAVGGTIAGRLPHRTVRAHFCICPVPRNAGSVPGQPGSPLTLLHAQRLVYPITDLGPVTPLNPISSLASRNARNCPRFNPSAACMLTINSQRAELRLAPGSSCIDKAHRPHRQGG